MHQESSAISRKILRKMIDILQIIICWPCNIIYMCLKRQSAVKDDTQTLNLWRRRDNRIVNSKCKTSTVTQFWFSTYWYYFSLLIINFEKIAYKPWRNFRKTKQKGRRRLYWIRLQGNIELSVICITVKIYIKLMENLS